MKAITLVVHLDGSLRIASDKITEADARRWAANGYAVVRVERAPTADGGWEIFDVLSGRRFVAEPRGVAPAAVELPSPPDGK